MINNSTIKKEGASGLSRSGVSSLNLSQLSLASTTSSANLSTSSLSRGWGSAQTRSAYADLSSLAAPQKSSASMQRPFSPNQDEGWGYFVDTPDHVNSSWT